MATPTDEMKFAESASPICWYEVAKRLHESARRLHAGRDRSRIRYVNAVRGVDAEHSEVNRSVFLLAGFALENILKAYLVYENPSYISGGRLGRPLKSHVLAELHDRCRLAPHKRRYRALMSLFEEGLSSWARYPCGLNANDADLEKAFTERVWVRYERAFDDLSKRLERMLSRPWRGPHGTGGRVVFEHFA